MEGGKSIPHSWVGPTIAGVPKQSRSQRQPEQEPRTRNSEPSPPELEPASASRSQYAPDRMHARTNETKRIETILPDGLPPHNLRYIGKHPWSPSADSIPPWPASPQWHSAVHEHTTISCSTSYARTNVKILEHTYYIRLRHFTKLKLSVQTARF